MQKTAPELLSITNALAFKPIIRSTGIEGIKTFRSNLEAKSEVLGIPPEALGELLPTICLHTQKLVNVALKPVFCHLPPNKPGSS